MTDYIIRFAESPLKNGSQASDSDDQEIENIDDEHEVKQAVTKAFDLAKNILKDKVTQVVFGVENNDSEPIWGGEGIIFGDKLKITLLVKK